MKLMSPSTERRTPMLVLVVDIGLKNQHNSLLLYHEKRLTTNKWGEEGGGKPCDRRKEYDTEVR
jgi:hypothetical protein